MKGAKKEEKWCILVGTETSSRMFVRVIGHKSKKIIEENIVDDGRAKYYLEDGLPAIFDRDSCMAVLLDIFEFEPFGYSNIMVFCKEFSQALFNRQIPFRFYSHNIIFLSQCLIAAKIQSPSRGDIVICIETASSEDGEISVSELCYTKKGYEQIRCDRIHFDGNVRAFKHEILGDSENPTHIIVVYDAKKDVIFNPLKNIFSRRKILRVPKTTVENPQNLLIISKYLLFASIKKFHVLSVCAKDFNVFADREEPEIVVEKDENLPILEEVFVSRDSANISLFTNCNKTKLLSLPQTEQSCHSFKILLHVDKNNFPKLHVEPMTLDIIRDLPKFSKAKFPTYDPVIAFCDNFSVICVVKNGDNSYSFSEEWNGVNGIDASYGKIQNQSIHGFKATELKEKNPSTFLTHMISLMCKDDLTAVKDPVFNGKTDEEREMVLCDYMHEWINQHIEVILRETGEPIETVRICFIFPGNREEEISNFKKRFAPAWGSLQPDFAYFKIQELDSKDSNDII